MKIISISLVLFFTCISFLHTTAQEVVVSSQRGERLLTWEDFQGKPDRSSPFFAETFWDLDFKTTAIGSNSDNISSKNVALTLTFNHRKSWLKKDKGTGELLKHEQGHFDIGRLCQLEILSILQTTVLTKTNFATTVQSVFDAGFKKYVALGKKYDEETNHSINSNKQEDWNNFLQLEKERLLKLNQ